MSRQKGVRILPANFEVKKAAPIDARMLVSSYADLLSFTNADKPYNGMLVSVLDSDFTKAGLYRLINEDSLDSDGSWEKIGFHLTPTLGEVLEAGNEATDTIFLYSSSQPTINAAYNGHSINFTKNDTSARSYFNIEDMYFAKKNLTTGITDYGRILFDDRLRVTSTKKVEIFTYSGSTPIGGFIVQENTGKVSVTTSLGIGLENPTETLHVTGNGLFSGTITASGGFDTSLRSTKNIISAFDDSVLSIIKNFKLYLFTYKDDIKENINLGMMLDEVKSLEKDYLINKDETAINRLSITTLHTKAIQELIDENNQLKDELAKIKKHLGL